MTTGAYNRTKTTDFGFADVAWQEKAQRVRGVFDSVASRYDLMNDLMSGGAHRLWKRFALSLTGCAAASARWMWPAAPAICRSDSRGRWARSGLVVLTDINAAMLARGRDRLIDAGLVGNVQCVQANAECLPFADAQLRLRDHRLRPAQRHRQAGRAGSMRRVLKPGGQLLVLEFSKPVHPGLRPALRRLFIQRAAACSASSSPAMPTATATWPNRSASIPTRRRCSA